MTAAEQSPPHVSRPRRDESAAVNETVRPEYFDAYDARVEATRLVHWLQDMFVNPSENTVILPDLIREEKDGVRIFRIGHWRFKISVLLDDERGFPPQVWIVMETSHKEVPDPPAINIAAFVDFTSNHCRINYAPEEGMSMKSVVISTETLKPEWLSEAALAKIRQKIDGIPRRIQSPGVLKSLFGRIFRR